MHAANVYPREGDEVNAQRVFDQYTRDGVVETRSRKEAENTGWVKNYSPILVVPKDESEVRPVLDGSSSGLNAALSPWGMSLPSFLHFALMV